MSSKIIQALKTVDYRDAAVRSLWTFAQAFLAVVLLSSDMLVDKIFTGDWNGLYSLAIAVTLGGIAAGLSAVKTVLVSVIADIKQKSV